VTGDANCHGLVRPYRDIPPEKLPADPGFLQFVPDTRRRGKARLGALVTGLNRPHPGTREVPREKPASRWTAGQGSKEKPREAAELSGARFATAVVSGSYVELLSKN
jgi:hypothetical protein